MRIQNNITAMNSHRQLGISQSGQAKSTEKLSSGYRINRAADDAAGLYISEKMRSQIRGLNQASANAQDGISLVQAAEGALQETHSILQRMRELSDKAANDVNEAEDRDAIQAEIDQLTKEVDRIAYTTEFNKKTLLDGSLNDGVKSAKSISGKGVNAGITVSAGFDAGIYSITVACAGVKEKTAYEFNLAGASDGDTVTISMTALDNVTGAGTDEAGRAGLDNLAAGDIFSFTATGNVAQDNATAVNMLKDALSSISQDYDVTSEGNKIILTAKYAGEHTDAAGQLTFSVSAVAADGTDVTGNISDFRGDTAIAIDTGTNELVQVNGQDATALTRNGFYMIDADDLGGTAGEELTFSMSDVTKLSSAIVEVKAGRSLTLQVGANTSVDQTIGLAVKNLSAAAMGIDNLSVHNNESSRAAIAAIDKALSAVSLQRSDLGAVQNRLEHTIANLDTVSENLTSAESRIRDVDMAKEMMNFTKENILQQAGTAMLAQANQLPQGVLQLLQ